MMAAFSAAASVLVRAALFLWCARAKHEPNIGKFRRGAHVRVSVYLTVFH